MKLHKIELTGYCAKSPDGQALYLGTAGSYGNEQLAVTLGKGWDGLTVTATFQPAGVTVLVPGDGTLDVPWEATETALDAAKGRIVFEGVTDGRVLISTDIPYAVGSHSDTDGSNSQPPTPSEWEQYVDKVKGDADRAEQAAKDAEASVQDVKDAGAQAVTDIGAAKDSALDAIAKAGEDVAGSITADVQAAKDAAAAAEQSAKDAEQSAKDAAAVLANVQSAGQSVLDDIATERQNALSDIQNEGAKQQSAVAGAGTAALEAIGQTEQAAINQVKQAGETQAAAVQSAGTTQVGLINNAGAAQVQAVKDEGAAQTSALDDAAAAHKTELEAIASHPPQPNTETGKWQVWNAETGAYQDTDALYQGGYYTASVSDDGTLTWQGSQEGMPGLPSVNIKGPKGDKGDPGLGVPSPTQADAGKVPMVNDDGTGYVLREVSAGGGDAGQPGTDGEDGGYYTPSVDTAGNLSWTPSKVGMPSVPEANIRGPEGPQGETGATPQLTIGTVTTLDPGEDATVTITGTAEAPVLNFGIPKGEPGEDGSAGLPTPTAADAGKALAVKPDGTGYQLAGPYAPLSAAIRPTVSGNPAVCENSVAWGLQGLKVYGKSTQTSNQLLPLTEDTYTTGGLTATLQGDGSLVVNGTPQSAPINLVFFSLNLEPGTYYVSGGVPTSGNLYLCVQIASPSGGGGFYVNQSFTITGNETSVTAMIQNVDTTPLNDYAISPMINRGNSALPIQKYAMPTPESPIPITSAGDGGNVEVLVTGKNLLDISKMQQKTTNGITFSLESGGIKINGTAAANTDSPTFTFRLPAGTYISNINRTQFPWISSVNYVVEKKGGSMRWLDADVAFTVLDEDIGKYFCFAVAKGKTVNEIIYPQLELGSVSTDYEPYTSQSLTISTPNGLPGIPVTSGGNYTIDGQQYRGNIRDYGAEVDTIAVEQIDSYNGEDVGDVWMSSTGQLTTGAQVVYALDELTTQAIPATEMAAYRALQTYDGVTMVSTAEDVAGLEVKYVADAQKYIDDRLTAAESHIQEIAAAQLNAQTGG